MAIHGDGPPRSTVADVLAAIQYHYASTASQGAWATATSYAVGDTASSGGITYVCYAAGVSTAAPTGTGTTTPATTGAGWHPFLYVGERYLKQHGAPPTIVVVPGPGTIGAPTSIGAGNVAKDTEEIRAFLWAPEALGDIARYTAIEDMKDRFVNVLRKIIPGKLAMRQVNPALLTNILTFGEDRQIIAEYTREVPRDAEIWNVPIVPKSPPDPDRPNGPTPYDFVVEATVEGNRS